MLFSIGCSAGEPGSAGPVVRDSAGIAIVENGEPIWAAGEGWRVLEEPAVDIGVLDGDPVYQLFDARDAARLASGEIVIANRGTQELRFYDAAGRFLRSAGREGEGPGEFRSLVSVAVVEDSIFAYDIRLNRISVFESTGRFVRSFRLESPADGRSYPSPVGALPDGSLLMGMRRVFHHGEERSGVHRDSVDYFRYSREGEILGAVARFPGGESFVRVADGTMSVTARAFGRRTEIAVHGGQIIVGATDTYEIGRYDAAGRLEALIRKRHENLPVTREDIERYKGQLDAMDEAIRPFMERAFADMPYPKTMPAYNGFRIDAEGYLWVEEYRRPGDDLPRWSIFDPAGRLLGTVETPFGLTILEIGSDYLLGFWQDEFEVEHVRVHRLERGESGPLSMSRSGPTGEGQRG